VAKVELGSEVEFAESFDAVCELCGTFLPQFPEAVLSRTLAVGTCLVLSFDKALATELLSEYFPMEFNFNRFTGLYNDTASGSPEVPESLSLE
jgi:hypothetical protein